MLFSNELQKATQIAARVRVAVEIEFRIADLVPVPGDAKVDRIDAKLPVAVERPEPQVGRNPKIVKLGGMQEKWDAVDTQLGFAGGRNDLHAGRWCNRFLGRRLLSRGVRGKKCGDKNCYEKPARGATECLGFIVARVSCPECTRRVRHGVFFRIAQTSLASKNASYNLPRVGVPPRHET